MDRFIYALSIPLIGKSASKTIAKHFNYDMQSMSNQMSYEMDFTTLNDFGSAMNESIQCFYSDNEEWITKLAEEFTFEIPATKSMAKDLTGKVFVITGSLEQFSNRDAAVAEIETLGGKVSGSVSAKTTYLVNNDVNSVSSKNVKAKSLGIPIITEKQLIEMVR